MSGPNAEQASLEPHEVQSLLAIYRAHRRPLGEECICGADGCRLGADARRQLWMAGINPERPS